MIPKNETFVNRLAKFNLFTFYLMGVLSLTTFILGDYQKAGIQLILSLLNLYTYFDIMEDEE